MAALSIWRDSFVDFGALDSIVYRIRRQGAGDVIFSGRAYRRPGESTIKVRVNDICADYLTNPLPVLEQGHFTPLDVGTFGIYAQQEGGWRKLENRQYINDWSFDNDFDPVRSGMSFPISDRVDYRMPIVWTGYNQTEITATIYTRGGQTWRLVIPVTTSNDFNNDFNDDYSHSNEAANGTVVIYPDVWENVERIEVGGRFYEVVTGCAEYALYYVNAYGGWDALLIEGKVIETDTLQRYTREVDYDNNDPEARGVDNYANEIKKGLTLHTGWLYGEQGARMHHLTNSTDVYLYHISSRALVPVIIPATTTEYKTFRTEGRLVNYAIQIQLAQNRVRR